MYPEESLSTLNVTKELQEYFFKLIFIVKQLF